jgi:hypothetical protein
VEISNVKVSSIQDKEEKKRHEISTKSSSKKLKKERKQIKLKIK